MSGDSPTGPLRRAAMSLGAFSLMLLAVLIAFYFPFLIGGESFYLSDLTYYYEPFCRFIGEALAQNRLPLWNPYCYGGMAQIAVPAPGIFYPPNWLFAFMPFSIGMAVQLIFHQWVAGLGGYLVVRHWRWGATAAWLCGLILALSGYMFGLQANYSLPATAAWAPLCWWGISRIRSAGDDTNLLFVALTSVLVSSLVASGRPELFTLILLILSLYMAASFALDWRAGNRRTAAGEVLWRALAIVSGTLIAMPSVLPVQEWASLSPRATGMTASEVFLWSANWYDYLCLLVWQPLGDCYVRGTRFLSIISSRAGYLPYLTSAFLGPFVLTLAVWGALDRTWRWRWVCLSALLIGIVATLGNRTPIFPALMSGIPALSVFRYPIKLMILPVWCLTILAARGACLVTSSALPVRSLFVAAGGWTLLLVCSLVLLLVPDLLFWLLKGSAGQPAIPGDVCGTAQSLIGQAGSISCALGLAMSTAAWAAGKWRMSKKSTSIALLVFSAGSLLWHAAMYAGQGADAGFFEQPSFVKDTLAKIMPADSGLFSGQKRMLPLYFDPLACPASYHGKGLGSQTPYFYQYSRQLLLPNTNIDAKLAGAYGYESAISADYRKIYHAVRNRSAPVAKGHNKAAGSSVAAADDLPLSTFCRMTATEIVLTQCFGFGAKPPEVPLLSSDFFEKILESRDMNVRIFKVKDCLPRAYIARSWALVQSHEDAVEQVSHPDRSGFNPGDKTLIEPHTVFGYNPKPGEIDRDAREGSWVKFLQDLPEHVSLSVKAEQDSIIVLADHYYPGWHARLDNIPVDIHCANALQRAVFVPAGSHLLEFDYQPESLETAFGWTKFGLTIVLGIVLLVAARKFWRLAKRQSRGW